MICAPKRGLWETKEEGYTMLRCREKWEAEVRCAGRSGSSPANGGFARNARVVHEWENIEWCGSPVGVSITGGGGEDVL